MKPLESMTDTEAELSGKAAGLLLMHVLPAYRTLYGSHEAAVARINDLLAASKNDGKSPLDAETVLRYMLQINA